MAQSKFKAAGGGFLNNVDGVIQGYQFTDSFNGHPFVPGINPKTKEPKFHSLYNVLSVLVDGSEKPVTTTLFAGDYDQFEISEDGLTLTPIEDGFVLGGGTGLAKFIQSYDALNEAGASGDDDTVVNYEPIIGARVRFVQQPLDAGELASLKRRGKPTTRKDAKGKEWPLQNLIVEAVYDRPEPVKVTGKGKVAAKGNGKAAASPSVDDLAIATLIDIVKGNGGSIAKSKLSMRVLKALTGNPQQNAVRTLVNNDDFLNKETGWTYNEKSQTVELSE
jgi:hypothetical protein